MSDLAKVMKGLACCSVYNWNGAYVCGDCPYHDTGGDFCAEILCADALALLNEQEEEEVLPIEDSDYIWVCGNCGEEIYNDGELRDNYCANCGKKVKWQTEQGTGEAR